MVLEYHPPSPGKILKLYIVHIFDRKMVRNAVSAFLNTLTMGTVRLEVIPGVIVCILVEKTHRGDFLFACVLAEITS